MRTVRAWAWTAPALAGIAAAQAVSWPGSGAAGWLELPWRLFGLAGVVIGFLALRSTSWTRAGPLIVTLGAAYYLGELRAAEHPVVFAAGFCGAYLWVGVTAQLALTWPTGRIGDRTTGAVIVVCYLAAVGSQVARYLADRPRPPWYFSTAYPYTPAAKAGSVLLVACALLVAAVIVRRWSRASPVRRRPSAPVWAAIVSTALLGTSAALASLLEAPVAAENALLLTALAVAVALVPVMVFARFARMARARWRLTALVLEHELHTEPDQLERRLAEALGDPSLRLAYVAEDGAHVDGRGRPAGLAAAPYRAITPVRRGGAVIAVIEHDEALHEQRQIARTAAEVAGVAIEGARRYALIGAQVEQLRTSRLRLAATAFEERRRIQRDLHDGAQQQLFAVLVLIDLARRRLAPGDSGDGEGLAVLKRAHAQLRDAIQALRELTQGIYPTTLVEHGLAAAVEGLADVAPIPVSFTVPRGRWPRPAETTAYFAISEALTNCYKHAQAGHVEIRVEHDGDGLRIEVRDDGRGGAVDPGGLRDRVSTVGGRVEIDSTPGQGTTVVLHVPTEMS
ncbi:sensor histidine kinase [Nonomuraea typhae]|uniref:histidine kinase n=1 Tax=Nonomuraea typhae TaxID=2603600 RepID=A0ABW7Z4P9_9ACTN